MNSCFVHPRRFFFPVLFLVLINTPNLTRAQCASPATSSFPATITVCPSADINYLAVVRSVNNLPCPNEVVTMVITPNCAGTICGTPFTQTVSSNLAGVLVFTPSGGGCCVGAVSFFDVAGILVGTAQFLGSPDMSADCAVNLSDVVTFVGFLTSGVYSRCADFNGDGVINLSDVVVLSAHIGH